MDLIISGVVRKMFDNIDTDQIYPGRYLELTDKKEIASHCLEGLRTNFADKCAENAVIVAGKNFGCGSSREHAVITLKESGVRLVIASSFARIFFRNAINLGLPLLICKESPKLADENHILTANLASGVITNDSTARIYQGELLPDFILDMIRDGGIKKRFKKLER